MSTASIHRESRSPADHLRSRDLTCWRISRQGSRCPAAGLAKTHLHEQHEQLTPICQVRWIVGDREKAIAEGPGPAIPRTFGDMLQSGNIGLEDGGK